MKKINTSPISGMQELLPAAQATFDRLKTTISEVYHRHGFMSIETPVIDRTEILLAKAGGDTEKQIYKVIKTTESKDSADQALRFDHTVPLARYVVEHENDLPFPFKVSQIGRNYRGERAQKGRFREFYQCDVDVVGRGDLPLYYDADVIMTLLDAFQSFGLGTPVVARINNRKILSGLIAATNLESNAKDIYSIIDHSEKVPPEKTHAALAEIGLGSERGAMLERFMEIHGSRAEVMQALANFNITNDLWSEGLAELDTTMSLLEDAGLSEQIRADMKIVRGLDYYTGTVFEFNLPEYPHVGSVCGGGRYDNLAGYFTDQKLPGVGGSIGLTRLYYILSTNGLLSDTITKPIDVAVVPISAAELPYAIKVAAELRQSGTSATLVTSDKKLGDKLKYASQIALRAAVIGENEVQTNHYEFKNFQ